MDKFIEITEEQIKEETLCVIINMNVVEVKSSQLNYFFFTANTI